MTGSFLQSCSLTISRYCNPGHTLYRLLTRQTFQLVYLARADPFGSHGEAIKHMLRSRGDVQLYAPSSFSLWRLAHFRLQCRQILLREHPDAEQVAWVNKLNTAQPDLHICADVLHMCILSAASKRLTEDIDTDMPRADKLERAMQLAQEIRALTRTIESWTSEMTGIWRPTTIEVEHLAPPQDIHEPSNFPIPHFPCPRFLNYHDVWLVGDVPFVL